MMNEPIHDAMTPPASEEQIKDLPPIENAEEQVRGGDSTKPTESLSLSFGALQIKNVQQSSD